MEITIREGNYRKFGVFAEGNGFIFTFAGEKEKDCFIRIYDKENQLMERILVPKEFCMGSVRSVWIGGLKEKELRYNYEIDGKVLPDIYADKIYGREVFNDISRNEKDFFVCCGKEKQSFNWTGDVFPEVPRNEMVMYKLHTRGFSMDSGVRGRKKGTFAAISDKIEYLKELGITTVELMPIYEFEELIFEEKPEVPAYVRQQAKGENAVLLEESETKVIGLNYWGYAQGNYFAVKSSYASSRNASKELKELIKKLHQNGLECVLEMCFPSDMNQNIILDVLRFWVKEYHVDGFHLIGESVPVKAICQDLFLSRTKIFCEAFDDEIYYLEKAYPNYFAYNDGYLYPTRMLLNHAGGTLEEFANQQRKQHQKVGFVNYITNNNGFTLMDLFSYQEKHNEDNGEGNADGLMWNFSSNCGIEGKTNKRYVNTMRRRMLLNSFAMLFFAQGVPLVLAGDEMGNSQNGNNNAYCQDNRISWLNWKRDEKNIWLTQFVKQLAAFRKEHPVIASNQPMQFSDYKRKGYPDLSYHGESAWISGFHEVYSAFGMMYCGGYAEKKDGTEDDMIYIGYNFHTGMTHLALPKLSKEKNWYLVMDTSELASPFLEEEVCLEDQQLLAVKGQSIVVLIGK